MFNTMCYFNSKSIIYYGSKREIKIPFDQFEFCFPSNKNPQIFWNKAVAELFNSRGASLHQLYHLAAVIEKIFPGGWAWEEQFEYYENLFYSEKTSIEVYMKAHNMYVRPEFFDDYSEWSWMAKVEEWFKDQGLYKTREEIESETVRKVKELIYDRALTDFIVLPEILQKMSDRT